MCVLLALATAVVAIELTVGVLAPGGLTPDGMVAVDRVRGLVIGVGAVVAALLGGALAVSITRPLRRLLHNIRERLEPGWVAQPVNELRELSNAFDHMLLSFDKFVSDSQILQAMPVGVLVVGRDNRIKRANAEAERLLHSVGGSLDGRSLTEIPELAAAGALGEAVEDVRAHGVPVDVPGPAAASNTDGGMERILSVVPGGAPGEVAVTLRDPGRISAIRDAIQRVDQLAALGAHVASLAHEVSGSLMAVQTLADLLEPATDADRAIRDKLQQGLERAGRLMDEIRAFGRVTVRERVPCDVNRLTEETLWVVQARFLPKRIRVVKQLATGLPPVMGDRDRLTQAFINVLTNAFEATPPGGTIRVVTERADDRIALRVANTGSYIPPEEQDKIFTLFYSTKKHGTGFGLPIARRAILDHRGDIRVRSAPDTGTEFLIQIPVT